MHRGGRRFKAGRKATLLPNMKRTTLSIRLPHWIIDSLGKNKGEKIETALIHHYQLKKPSDDDKYTPPRFLKNDC